ncbi:MAG: hypothetical protein JRI68_05935 [Deltaproteobacteria bacterium]|nr:hypothetical protein [Deltaproteobacteria bacterium]
MSKPTSARGRLTGRLWSVALALGASGCIVDVPDGEDELGLAEAPLAAWEADDQDVRPALWDRQDPRRPGEPVEPVGLDADATAGGSDAQGNDDPSNPDPTPWQGSAANAAGGDGNPDPTPWNSSDEEEGEEGGNDEGSESEPDPQPWMNDVSIDADDND